MKKFLRETTLPLLLCWVIMISISYIYVHDDSWAVVGFVFFSLIYSVVIFVVLDFFRRINKALVSTAGVLGLFIVSSVLSNVTRDTSPYNMFKWFMDPYSIDGIHIGNTFSLLFLIGFILGSAEYYFTVIRFRKLFVFLICMSPFSLFAKTFTEIPAILMILLTVIFLALVIMNSTDTKKGKEYIIPLASVILVVTSVASFFPKLDAAPYRSTFDEMITGVKIGAIGGVNFGDFSDTSSVGGNSQTNNEDVIFYLYGDNPVLIKSRIYECYNKEKGLWEYYGDHNNGTNSWRKNTDRYYPELLAETAGFTHPKSTVRKCYIMSNVGAIQALYTAENTISINSQDFSAKDVYKNEADEYFFSYTDKGKYQGYTLEWLDVKKDNGFVEKMSSEFPVSSSASAVKQYMDSYNEAVKHNNVHMSEETRRACYKSDTTYENVKKLAEEITKGLKTDYEKALAIENYFHSDEYKYDLNFKPADKSIEAFIFNTKRGVCAQYATAMALLCRECGLTTRYVEGYAVTKYDRTEQRYYATQADAHGYVQCWIDGYGWTDFNPTSSNDVTDAGTDYTFLIVGILTLAVVISVILFFVLRPKVREMKFVGRISKTRGKAQAVMIYDRITAILLDRLGKDECTYTPSEVGELLKNTLSCDMDEFINRYLSVSYSENDCDSDLSGYYKSFREMLKASKKKKG